MKIKIWTEAYRPLIMGGDVNAPIGCEITIDAECVELSPTVSVFEAWRAKLPTEQV